LDEQGRQLELTEIRKREFTKINYNSFAEIKEIEDLKTRKKFKPRYSSRRYGTYYDRRVNKMIYGNTAYITDRENFSVASYNVLLINSSIALSSKIESDLYFLNFADNVFLMAHLKYSIVSSEHLQIALRTGLKNYQSKSLAGDTRSSYRGLPQSVLITIGNIDYFLSGTFTIEPFSQTNNEGDKEFTPFTYNLGISCRLSKHLSSSFEIFNSYPLPQSSGLDSFKNYSVVTGIRLFWSKNSIDFGLLDTFERSDRFMPIITYTHHFYTE